jgi:hypothetical protein
MSPGSDTEAAAQVGLAGPPAFLEGGEQRVLLTVRAGSPEPCVAETLRPEGGLAQQPARQAAQPGRRGVEIHAPDRTGCW